MTTQPVTLTHWPRIAAVLFAGVAIALHVGKVPPAIPALSTELDLDLVTSGWLLSLFAVIGALSGSMVGHLVDRVGCRTALLVGLACATAGSFLGSAADGGSLLLLSRALESAGSVLAIVSAPSLILRDCGGDDQRLAFGLWGCWLPVGTAVMMALSPLLLSGYGWRASWLTAGSLSLAALIVARSVLCRDPPSAPRHLAGGLGQVLRLSQSWLLTANFCCYSMSFMTVIGFLPTFLVKEHHIGANWVVALAAGAMLANAGGNLLAGWLARRGQPRWRLIFIACLSMAISPWGIFIDFLPMPLRYALCVYFALAGGLLPATILAAVPAVVPRGQVGPLNGMLVQGISIGQLAGPPILAFLVQTLGSWSVAPIYLSATGAAGACLALAFRRKELRNGK